MTDRPEWVRALDMTTDRDGHPLDMGPVDDDGHGRSQCPGNHWGHMYSCLRIEW